MVNALLNWRTLLAGSPHEIIVCTDHANLQYWTQPHKISCWVACLMQALEEFPIRIQHIPGKTNTHAGTLSRHPDYDQGDRDNEDIVVLPERLFIKAARTTQDYKVLRPWVDAHNLKEYKGNWWKDNREVVTRDTHVQWQIIKEHHDLPAYGHPGISRTTNLISQRFWWPKLASEVEMYIKGCADCQQNKSNTQIKKAPLLPIYPKPDATPFSTISLDFIVKLPTSEGYDSILTITDQGCTKLAIFIPCHKTINAEGVAKLYFHNVFPCFGIPSKIITNWDPWFTSQFMKELCKQLKIEQNIFTAYHPRTDEQSEHTNQWLEQYLRFWVNHQQDNWYHFIPMAEFAHNSWRNETTGVSPYQVLMGYNPAAERWPATSTVPAPINQLEQWKKARESATIQMKRAQNRWAQAKHQGWTFQEGDLVWLEGGNLHLDQPSIKLAAKRHGPFPVTQVLSPITYQLTLPSQWKIHPVFHVDLLTPYKETELHGPNYMRPPPDLIDGEEEFKVECILNSRCFGRQKKVQYLVKWLGYPDSAISHMRLAFCVPSSSPSPPMTSSPSPSTIEDVVGPTTTATIQELTITAPLSASDLETILSHFKSPVQEPDKESITSQITFPSGLVSNASAVTGTATPH